MLKKVISGGQTGADYQGLVAAKLCGLATGGWIPKNFRTEDGNRPELKEEFGIKEHTSYQYPPRTFANARDSDGTIRLACDFSTAGEKLTLKAIHQYNKPYIDVDMNDPRPFQEVAEWLVSNKIETLNVAGNAASKCPLSFSEDVKDYLVKVFNSVKNCKY